MNTKHNVPTALRVRGQQSLNCGYGPGARYNSGAFLSLAVLTVWAGCARPGVRTNCPL